jgi:DNA-binding response OmpR family regulator
MICGPLTLDTRNGRATVDGQALTLTSHEYRVLAYLMHHRDEVISRSDLVEHIYAQDFDRDSNTVEVFIARLRKKLPPGLIETVRGLGYRLSAPNDGHDQGWRICLAARLAALAPAGRHPGLDRRIDHRCRLGA